MEEKEIIKKDGLQIRVLKSRRIQYKKGDVLGNDITFLEEVESETLKKSSSSKYLVNIRKAKFKCYCGKDFIQKITLVKNKSVMSCGCYKVQKVKEYHERKKAKNENKR